MKNARMSGRRQTRNKKDVAQLTQQTGEIYQKAPKSKVSESEPIKGHNRLTAKQKKLDIFLENGLQIEKPDSSKIAISTSSTKGAKNNLKTLSETYGYTRKSKRTSNQVVNNKEEIDAKTNNNNNEEERMDKNKVIKPKEDDFLHRLGTSGFEKAEKSLKINVFKPTAYTSHNMVHHLQHMAFGIKSRLQMHETVKKPIVDLCREFRLCRVASPFDRRVTAIEWHPTQNNIVAVGSKGGDIILWNTETVDKDKFVAGIGAAGSCQAIKFWPWDMSRVVSASINGTVTLHDFDGRQDDILADTMNSYDHWYCSVDVNPSRYMVAAGRNGGILHLMSSEGRKIFEYRLHKNKITHVEFSPKEDWLLCTASTDQTVQFWDVRNMSDRKSALAVLKHDKPVNSAYFSRTDGCRLLTTDQKNELRVYQSPEWVLETTIQHPHRFFQHITPFKATWHPLVDLIICGRYPDKEFPGYQSGEARTLDMFDAKTGEMVAKLHDPEVDGLCPLNKFNHQGDTLVSGMGFHIKLWHRKEVIDLVQEQIKEKLLSSNLLSGLSNRPNNRSRSSRDRGQGDTDDTDDLKKKKKRKLTTNSDVRTKTKSVKKK